jgi:hypothetical protein
VEPPTPILARGSAILFWVSPAGRWRRMLGQRMGFSLRDMHVIGSPDYKGSGSANNVGCFIVDTL